MTLNTTGTPAASDIESAAVTHTPSANPLAEFLKAAGTLTQQDRALIVDQAIVLLEGFYVHLPQKKAAYAVDPVQQLKLLRFRLDRITSDWDFHRAMTTIFNSVRDVHTNYELPSPFKAVMATLPFRVEHCTENDGDLYIVTGVTGEVAGDVFKAGVTVTHWNGVPIARAVARLSEDANVGNWPAQHAMATAGLTSRCLAFGLVPDEEWVVVQFIALDGTVHRTSFTWTATGLPDYEVDRLAYSKKASYDLQTALVQRVRQAQFAPHVLAKVANNPDNPDDKYSARTIKIAAGTFGYIRIWTFDSSYISYTGGLMGFGFPTGQVMGTNDDKFVDDFCGLLDKMPPEGLIIDVRDNGGGSCNAAEELLQLFTSKAIQPQGFQIISTPATRLITATNAGATDTDPVDNLALWAPSIAHAVETGAIFSAPIALTTVEKCNRRGQRYRGPVVLITSARCYSATDIFSAGFQDHEIGPVIGVDACTGAAGANVWHHDGLMDYFAASDGSQIAGSPLVKLPQDVSMRVAFRRTIRTGRNAGMELEDLGVVPDQLYRMTRRDLLEGNGDLMEAAGKALAALACRRLEGTATRPGQDIALDMTVEGLDRIDIYCDGRPQSSHDVTDGPFKLVVAAPAMLDAIKVVGFCKGEPAATKTFDRKAGRKAVYKLSPGYQIVIENTVLDFKAGTVSMDVFIDKIGRVAFAFGVPNTDQKPFADLALKPGWNHVTLPGMPCERGGYVPFVAQLLTILGYDGDQQVAYVEFYNYS